MIGDRFSSGGRDNQHSYEVMFFDESVNHQCGYLLDSRDDVWFSVDVLATEHLPYSYSLKPNDVKSLNSNESSSSQHNRSFVSRHSLSHKSDGKGPILQSYIDQFDSVVNEDDNPLLTSSLANDDNKRYTVFNALSLAFRWVPIFLCYEAS